MNYSQSGVLCSKTVLESLICSVLCQKEFQNKPVIHCPWQSLASFKMFITNWQTSSSPPTNNNIHISCTTHLNLAWPYKTKCRSFNRQSKACWTAGFKLLLFTLIWSLCLEHVSNDVQNSGDWGMVFKSTLPYIGLHNSKIYTDSTTCYLLFTAGKWVVALF